MRDIAAIPMAVPRGLVDTSCLRLRIRRLEVPIRLSSLSERVHWNRSSAVSCATPACGLCGKSARYALWRIPVSCTL
jgi:hypothetical protein